MRSVLALAMVALVLAGCALRPRYAEFVSRETKGASIQLQLRAVDGDPVAGATVEVGEYRSKVVAVTDAEGRFTLPVNKTFLADNPVLVVNAPPDTGRTRVDLAPQVAHNEWRPMELLPPASLEVDAGTSY